MRKFRRTCLILATTVAAMTAVGAGTAYAAVDTDGVAAGTPGAQISGNLYWQDFAGHVNWTITLRDTTPNDGLCATLYVRQRNAAGAASGWVYQAQQCNGTQRTYNGGGNTPFPGGTAYFDFKVVRNADYVAYDYNMLFGG